MEEFDFNKLITNSNKTLNTLNKGERFIRNTLNDADRLNRRFTQKAAVRNYQPYLGQGYRSDLYPYYMSRPISDYGYRY